MGRVFFCVSEEHDIRLVLLAGFLCLLACYTAFGMIARARHSSSGRARLAWTAAAATVAGCGVWATHFVAMLAFKTGLPLGYDGGLTAASVGVAISMIWAGLTLGLAAPALLAPGGALVGLAIGAMHYVGMAALRAPARLEYDAPYVVASLVIGAALAAVALPYAAGPGGLRRRLTGSSLLAAAICGLHFTAMAAVRLVPDPWIPLPDNAVIQPEWLAVAVAAAALLIIVLGLLGALLDEHLAERAGQEAERLRRHVAELEATKRQLEATAADLKSALQAAAAASEAKSQFVATMSHELRTPLNSILGFAELIAMEAAAPAAKPRDHDYAGEILRSGRRLLNLVNDILDYSKLQAGRIVLRDEEVDLQELVEQAMEAVRPAAAEAGLSLEAALEPGLPPLLADARRLRQALLNLLSNAVKFTGAGGGVRVHGGLRGDEVVISVTDTGIGIAPDQLGAVLEQFGQVDGALNRKYEGTGLGLPLSKKLMELHGGALRIESAGAGAGTTASIVLPGARLLQDPDLALRAA